MAEEYTCNECENLYDDSDGDTDERMCNKCLDRIYDESGVIDVDKDEIDCIECGDKFNKFQGDVDERTCTTCILKAEDPEAICTSWQRVKVPHIHRRGYIMEKTERDNLQQDEQQVESD